MLVLLQFSTKIDGFEQKDSQGFENSYNSYEQYPLEKFFIFTIYQNYTLAFNSTVRFSITFIKSWFNIQIGLLQQECKMHVFRLNKIKLCNMPDQYC